MECAGDDGDGGEMYGGGHSRSFIYCGEALGVGVRGTEEKLMHLFFLSFFPNAARTKRLNGYVICYIFLKEL